MNRMEKRAPRGRPPTCQQMKRYTKNLQRCLAGARAENGKCEEEKRNLDEANKNLKMENDETKQENENLKMEIEILKQEIEETSQCCEYSQ